MWSFIGFASQPGERARQDSNLRPIAPEAIALSPELRAPVSEGYRSAQPNRCSSEAV